MVLGLPLPEPQHNIGSDGDLLKHLLTYSELFWTYVLSFLLLGYFWINQQKLFKYVNNTCTHHLWANLGELLLVCVIPFSSGLVGDHINYITASIIFHTNILLIGMFFLFQCALLLKFPDILKKDVSRKMALRIVKINLVIPILAVTGMIVAFFSPQLSLAVYAVAPILTSIVAKRTSE